jgi:integrase
MTIVHVKGFQIFKDRHGKMRCYHRKSRIAIDLESAPIGSAPFLSECARITQQLQPDLAARPGTLGRLICDYRASPNFTDLAPRTRSDYERCFDYLKPISNTALSRFDRSVVVKIRDKAFGTRGRRFANYVKASLSILFSWGAERGYIAGNPAEKVRNVRRPKGLPEPNRTWSDEERHAVLSAAQSHMLPAFALMMFTGLGPKDALRLPRSFYKDREIATRRSKTGEPVFWAAPEALAQILEHQPKHMAVTLCANSLGRPWTESGFRASWRKLRLELEKQGLIGPGLTLYGLRHTVAVILRESGADERTIADALGQKTIEMARHYARGADLRCKMRGVVARFDEEVNRRRTNAVKLE